MIIVAAHILTKKGSQDDFVQKAKHCILETRKEEGNLSYNLLSDTEDSCKFTFLEEWESQPALDLHMKTKHFQQLGASIEDLLAAPLAIDVYEVKK